MPTSLNFKNFSLSTGQAFKIDSKVATVSGASLTNLEVGIIWLGGSLNLAGTVKTASESFSWFSYSDFVAGKITFTADGSTMPNLQFWVREKGSDSLPEAGSRGVVPPIVYKHLNQAPKLSRFNLGEISEGAETEVSTSMISVSDLETPVDQLGKISFKVTKITGGNFIVYGVATKTFTYADVEHGLVFFRHDGKNLAPTISLQAFDASSKPLGSSPHSAELTFHTVDDAPVLVVKTATVKLSSKLIDGTSVITPVRIALKSLVSLSDDETPAAGLATYRFTHEVSGCSLVNKDGLVQSPSSSFTYAEMANLFIQVSTYSGDAYVRLKSPDLSVDLPVFMNDPRPEDDNPGDAVTVVNQAPVVQGFELGFSWVSHDGGVLPGWTGGLTRWNFHFTDADKLSDGSSRTASDEGISFIVSALKGCCFLMNGGVVNQFRLSDVDEGRVSLQHLGLPGVTPSFSLSAKDRFGATSKAVAIDYETDIRISVKAPLALTEGADLKLNAGNLLISASKQQMMAGFVIEIVTAVNCNIGQIDPLTKVFTPQSSFTYAELKTGKLVLRAGSDETMPELKLWVAGHSDSWLPLSFKTLNDAPLLPSLGDLVLNQGEATTLDSALFASAYDEELPSHLQDSLLVTLKSKIGLSFKINGLEVNSFSLADVTAGLVQVTRTDINASWSLVLSDNLGLTMKNPVIGEVVSNDPGKALVAITSEHTENQWLSASVGEILDADGVGDITYIWQAYDGQKWEDFLWFDSNLLLTDSVAGKYLRVKIEYTDGHGVVERLYSAMTEKIINVNDAPTGSLHIQALPVPGGFLRVSENIQDEDGLGTRTYTWRNAIGEVLGTGVQLELTNDDLGQSISLIANYIDGHGSAETVSSSESVLIVSDVETPISNLSSYANASQPSVVLLKDAGWIISWNSWQIRFDSQGIPLGPIKTTEHAPPILAGLSDGGWIRFWTGYGSGPSLDWQRYDSHGDKLGNPGYHRAAATQLTDATGLADEAWLVTWNTRSDNGQTAVYQMHSGADNTGLEPILVAIGDSTHACYGGKTVVFADGSWLVTWMEGLKFGTSIYYVDADIMQRRFNADGSPLGEATRVNTSTSDSQDDAQVCLLADGGWVISWLSNHSEIRFQRFDAEGQPIGAEVSVNQGAWGSQSITALPDGGWVISWSQHGIWQQRYDSEGMPLGGASQVNQIRGGQEPEIAALPDGSWVVTWANDNPSNDQYGNSIFMQTFAPDTHGPAIDRTLRDTSAYDHFAPIVSQVPLNQSGWTFSGSSQGKYGSLVVQSTGQYVYTPNDEAINFLPSGTFTDSFVISGSKGEATRSEEISFAVVGVDDVVVNAGGFYSQILALPDGGWWLIWSKSKHLVMQHYASSGEKVGTEIALPEASLVQYARQPVLLANGDWLLHSFSYSFDLHQPSKSSIQRFSADGQAVGDAIVFDQSDRMSVCALSDGGWVVVYPNDGHAFLRRFGADGKMLSDGDLSLGTDLEGYYLKIASLPNGGWALSWLENLAQTQAQYLKVFEADGSSTAAIMINEFPWSQYPRISLDSLVNGNLVISSSDYTTGTTTLKVMTPAGVEVFHETYQDDNLPEITNLNDGTWLARIGLEANGLWQHFASDGSLLAVDASTLKTDSIEGLQDGGWILVGSDGMQRYDSSGHILSFSEQHGTAAADTLTGSAGARDRFYELGAGDSASGLAGQDLFELSSIAFAAINGGSDDDTLRLTFDLDLSLIASKLISIEKLDLKGHAIQIDSADITALGGSLVIDGSASSSVTLSEEWLETGDSSGYQHLTHGDLILLIALAIPVL